MTDLAHRADIMKLERLIQRAAWAPKGRTSPEQKAMHARLRHVGVYVYVCRSLDDVRRVINACGIPTRDHFLKRRAA